MARAFLLIYAEEERRRSVLRIERRRLRDASDPLQLPEKEFIGHFRLTKPGFQQILVELSPHLPIGKRNTRVRNELKILAALNFFANGTYQRSVGASFLLNMSQPTFSKCLHEVTDALNTRETLRKYIKFPMTKQEREIIIKDYMEKFGFPGVIGCIDGSHVALIRPKEHEEAYFNRKNYYSLNVLLICDAKLTISHVDASFGGESNDSYIWNQCAINTFLEELQRSGEQCWLLGDSEYDQQPWMMTPVLGATPGSPEEYYTDLHCRVRNTVEQCIRILKARWRCLLARRVLHYDPVTAGKIVNACVVLHNIANALNIPIPELQDGDIDNDQQHPVCIQDRINAPQDESRVILINKIWNARNIL